MYCPGCGAETFIGLKYCKRCGTNLATTALDARPPVYVHQPSASVAWAMALASTAIGLGGLGITVASVTDLIRPAPQSGGMVAVAIVMLVFGSLTTVTVVTLLIRLLSRVLGLTSEPHTTREANSRSAMIDRPQTAGYQPTLPPSPVATSVTEHTTRNFDAKLYDQSGRE